MQRWYHGINVAMKILTRLVPVDCQTEMRNDLNGRSATARRRTTTGLHEGHVPFVI